MRADEIHEFCREWVEEKHNKCNEPAEVILWGKLFPAEALGPRCRAHAEDHLGPGVWNLEDALRQGYAIFDLRNLRRVK